MSTKQPVHFLAAHVAAAIRSKIEYTVLEALMQFDFDQVLDDVEGVLGGAQGRDPNPTGGLVD